MMIRSLCQTLESLLNLCVQTKNNAQMDQLQQEGVGNRRNMHMYHQARMRYNTKIYIRKDRANTLGGEAGLPITRVAN